MSMPVSMRLLRVHAAPGFLAGMRQPATVVELVAESRPVDPAQLQRLQALLERGIVGLAELPPRPGLQGLDLVELLLRASHALLLGARFQLHHDELVLANRPARPDDDQHRFVRVAVPTHGHDHAVVAAILRTLIRAAHRLAADPSERSDAALLTSLSNLSTQLRFHGPTGFNTVNFLRAADERGIPWQRVSGNIYRFGWGHHARWLDSSFTDRTSSIGTALARDKGRTAALLREAGLPAPEHEVVQTADQAVRAARKFGWPVVLKPLDLDGGDGVVTGLKDEAALRRAWTATQAFGRPVMVQPHVEGNDYRLQVLHDDVFWVTHRVPGGVTGDGQATIEELLAALNADPLRGVPGSGLVLQRIAFDDEARELIAEQGLDADDVPEAGRFVRLRRAANVGNGGVPVPMLEHCHPENLALARRAARALRLDIAGIDVLMPDIRRSWLETGAAVIEVNAQPQMSPHLPAWVLSRLVRGDGRIPLVLVLGDVKAEPWFLQLLSSWRGLGHGVVTQDGAMLDGQRVAAAAPLVQSVAALLADPLTTGLLVVADDDQFLRSGAPADRFSALVLSGPVRDSGGGERRHALLLKHLAPRAAQLWLRRGAGAWPEALQGAAAPATEIIETPALAHRLHALLSGDPV